MVKLHPTLKKREFNYRDILLLPEEMPVGSMGDVDISSYITPRIKLGVPLISSPMDTVTEAPMAILMASLGAIGTLHYNHSIDKQMTELENVKSHEIGHDFLVKYPHPTLDSEGRLRVLIAVETRLNDARDRIDEAYKLGADGIVIDGSVMYASELDVARYVREHCPEMDVVVGNVASEKTIREVLRKTERSPSSLIFRLLGEESDSYIGAFRVGIGPGDACTTQPRMGTGRSQGSAVYHCSCASRGVRVWADGGIKEPGDVTKALALGASAAMLGSLLAGLDQSPAEKIEEGGKKFALFRGMASQEAIAMRQGASRYRANGGCIVPEGVIKKVPYLGNGYEFLPTYMAGIRQSIHKLGYQNVQTLQREARILPTAEYSMRH